MKVTNAIFNLLITENLYDVCKRKKRLRYNGKYIGQKSGHSDAELLQLPSA